MARKAGILEFMAHAVQYMTKMALFELTED